jgi:hypothetical protein
VTTLYYDPQLDVHHRLPVSAALTTAFYAAPQVAGDARRLFDAGCAAAGFTRPLPTPINASRAVGSSLVLAREWGLADLEGRLVEAIEASYEPTWDRDLGEFTWGLGLNEPYPRGQYNAFLAAAEAAGPGRWAALSAAPIPTCPQVVDVDVPTMALSRAEWVDGNLRLRLAPLREDPSATTTFRLVGAEPRNWDVHGLDGVRLDLSTTGLTITVPLVAADLDLIRGSY